MNWWKQLRSRRQLDQDLSAEIQEHLEERTDALVSGGMSRAEARLAARREFGNVTLLEERSRDVWRWGMLENFLSDLRYAFRQLRKSPAFTAAAVLTLALGIGANTAVFSVVNAVVLRPLPFPEPARLVAVAGLDRRRGPLPSNLSYPNFFDLRRYNHVFEYFVSYRASSFSLSGAGIPMHLTGAIVSADLLSLLRIQPALGRGFSPNDEQFGRRVVVLSHELWIEQYGGAPEILNRPIILDSLPYTVVGVMPPPSFSPLEIRK